MEHDERDWSQERVRALAEVVALPIKESRIPALADALDAARVMLAGLDSLPLGEVDAVPEPFDAAWPAARGRS